MYRMAFDFDPIAKKQSAQIEQQKAKKQTANSKMLIVKCGQQTASLSSI